MHEHIQAMADFYTEHTGVVLFRKHAVAYLQHYPMTREEKRTLLTTTKVASFMNYLNSLRLENRGNI